MRQPIILSISCLLLLVFAACGKVVDTPSKETTTTTTTTAPPASGQPTAQTNSPPADVVRASAAEVEMAAGDSAEAAVRLEIASGYHINANPPSFSFLKATELEAESGDGITAGKPVYPLSVTKKFSFFEKPIAVYEGEAIIKLPLNAATTASKGSHPLRAKLRIQACDDLACYPPRSLETSIPVTVK